MGSAGLRRGVQCEHRITHKRGGSGCSRDSCREARAGGVRGRGSRNGSTPKRLGTEVGDINLTTPRDREGSFEPHLVGKGQRRLDGLSDMIISLYLRGMTVRDIQHHLQATIGSELSHETISNITEVVA